MRKIKSPSRPVRRLGAGICEALRAGADVVGYRSDAPEADRTAATVRGIRRRALVVKVDVGDGHRFATCSQPLARVRAPDIVVANAGIGWAFLLDTTAEEFCE
jgi:NAD(P)-dependent dehydrogenase (short-subunit alcohol dehydrogenase family)